VRRRKVLGTSQDRLALEHQRHRRQNRIAVFERAGQEQSRRATVAANGRNENIGVKDGPSEHFDIISYAISPLPGRSDPSGCY